MNIGQRIKTLRIAKNLTQEELASRCELTKGYLSQLENNLVTPSLPTLADLVEVLGIDMSTFFKEEAPQKMIFRKDDYFIDEKEDFIIHWIVPNAQKNQMEPIILELKPQGKSEVITPCDGEEFGYVLEGKVTLVYGEEQYTISKGNDFYIVCDEEHYLINKTDRNVKILWVCTPPLF